MPLGPPASWQQRYPACMLSRFVESTATSSENFHSKLLLNLRGFPSSLDEILSRAGRVPGKEAGGVPEDGDEGGTAVGRASGCVGPAAQPPPLPPGCWLEGGLFLGVVSQLHR